MSRWSDPSRQVFWDDTTQNLTVPGTLIVQTISTYGIATFPTETNFSSINVSSIVGGNLFGNNLDIDTINADTYVYSQSMVASNSLNVGNLISTAAIQTSSLICYTIDSTITINTDSISTNNISSNSITVENLTIGSTNFYTTSYANPVVIDPTSTIGAAIYLTGSGPGGHQLIVGIDGQNNLNSQYGAGIIGMANLDPIIFFTDYTERMRIASTGQVGINTSSPGYTLDVNGTSFISTISTNNISTRAVVTSSIVSQTLSTGYVETNTFVGRLGFLSTCEINNLTVPNNFIFTTAVLSSFSTGSYTVGNGANNSRGFFVSAAGNDLINILSSGNMGIRMVPSTSYTLDVNGVERSKGLEIVSSNSITNSMIAALDNNQTSGLRTILLGRQNTIGNAAEIGFTYVAGNSTINRLNFGFVNNSSLMVVTNGGNVGIGTTAPADRLSVAGNIRTASNVLVGVNAVNYPMATAGYANVSMVGGNSHGFMFGAFNGLGDGMNLSYNYLHNNSTDIIPNPLGATSLLRLQYGQILFGTGANNTVPSTRMIITNTGNVGIGTSTPTQRVDVVGNINVSGFITNSNDNSCYVGINESQWITPNSANRPIAITAQSTGMYVFRPSNGNSRIHLNTLSGNTIISSFVVSEQGFVGIGCNVPAVRLDVAGAGLFQSNLTLKNMVANNVLVETANQLVLLSNTLGPYYYTQATTTGTARVRVGGYSNASAIPFTINESGGNVGINCNSPIVQLDVKGAGQFYGNTIPASAGGTAFYTGDYASPTAGRLIFGDGMGWYYRFATRSGSVTTDLVSIRDNGWVGIGTTTPTVPLDIATSNNIATGSGWNWFSDGNNASWNSSDSVSLRARGTIWSERRLIITSDKRIKKDIVDINLNDSYNVIQNINPVSFEYIDQTFGPSKNLGFIAQDIQTLLPEAISKQTNYIPNIYSFVSSSGSLFENSTILTFNYNFSTSFISSPIKFFDNDNKEYLGKIVDVESSSFKIQTESIDISKLQSTYFIYGTEVNDYLTIDKDSIFTINVSATKQLIKQVHTLQEKVDTYESRISTLEGLVIKQ